MDGGSILGNLIAQAIWVTLAAIAFFLYGRSKGWWGQATRRGKLVASAGAATLTVIALVVGYVAAQSPAPPVATKFAILVADLDGDANQAQTRHILHSLRMQFAEAIERRNVQVLSRGEALRLATGDIATAEFASQNRGRAWLKEQRADVLIWGEVGAADKILRLRFLAPEGGGDTPKPYPLNAELELPQSFGTDLAAIMALQAAASIDPYYERSHKALAGLIEPVAAKLAPLAENPPAIMSGETRARLWLAYAEGEQLIGEGRSDNAHLVYAITYFRKVLEEWTRDRRPLDWATAQNNLGNALTILGERENVTARLEEAVTAYRAALLERTRERVPHDWAKSQNNLGLALVRLGERESGTARLEEAVAAFREALKEQTREQAPLDWAGTQNSLGAALTDLGERESGTVRLVEAVAAYREALKEWTRERAPHDWAMTQNNLGTVLADLGERENDTGTLEEAVLAFHEALKEQTRELTPLDWAMTQDNLGNALINLGARQNGTARLKEAVLAFGEALKERKRERQPLDWGVTQNNLGNALARLGERESSTARIGEAVAALNESLKERTRERVPLQWAMTQNNLGAALKSLGERATPADKEKSCAALAKAREHYAEALEEFRKAGASYYVSLTEGNIAQLGAVVERLCG
jgi:tetratricopeptide (TPR) repeat protein